MTHLPSNKSFKVNCNALVSEIKQNSAMYITAHFSFRAPVSWNN